MKKPVMLMILDGWGINNNLDEKNAIRESNPENFNNYWNSYPHTTILASGEAVGLPEGQMGNSEVGHLNIGSGRVIYQPLVKISKEIKDGNILKNEALLNAMNSAKENNKTLHLMGLLSDGGVHSHIEHLFGLLDMAKTLGVESVAVHAILDGRDTPPKSSVNYVKKLQEKIKEIGIGEIATISGRYYTMDRDNRWDRIEKAYDAIVNGAGDKTFNPVKSIELAYEDDITDEFIKPTVVSDKAGNPLNPIKNGDSVIFFNFRPDRAREITRAINDKKFDNFTRLNNPKVNFVCMTQYDITIEAPVAYTPESLDNVLGKVISDKGLKQLRTAETEKYAHVTFFFNGGVEEPFKNEDRKLVSSPKVATYDMKPEMSAYEVTDGLLEALDEDKYDMIIVNYANTDMVGHTGVFEAAEKAVKAVDECIAKVIEKVKSKDGIVFITADHGNADLMEDPKTHIPFTAHTINPVPFIVVSDELKNVKLRNDGKLSDIAPTMLGVMGIEKPKEMTGKNLIEK
ncbi:2,3-bisphosphoglycerate-independent phosphoglycerate mutase [Haliovirga abyssi]|uniref:2,3-bisphosphoglycerate-independent phosphoglycerate mutase n=1 Tax=Haliovirga abyssi TaxID=2996794 RepID=A0AAU9DD92_9FUSO|nr:2,3-bisphosphoglycerate-independent phosphoglycerate mutase [Haliovirga abyssi]BDU50138.1 2,3-bisphosphoglycerate-independent phosphoglycerate mutase [Haliovirga abyssi]